MISVGAADKDGLPSVRDPGALKDYSVLRTDLNGWIEVSTDGSNMWVSSERKSAGPGVQAPGAAGQPAMMAGAPSGQVSLRAVIESDLPIFYEHQRDAEAVSMADFPSREREAHMLHWHKIMAEPANTLRTVLWDGEVAGNIVSWDASDGREVGYWIGREYWGHGIATRALQVVPSRSCHSAAVRACGPRTTSPRAVCSKSAALL